MSSMKKTSQTVDIVTMNDAQAIPIVVSASRGKPLFSSCALGLSKFRKALRSLSTLIAGRIITVRECRSVVCTLIGLPTYTGLSSPPPLKIRW